MIDNLHHDKSINFIVSSKQIYIILFWRCDFFQIKDFTSRNFLKSIYIIIVFYKNYCINNFSNNSIQDISILNLNHVFFQMLTKHMKPIFVYV